MNSSNTQTDSTPDLNSDSKSVPTPQPAMRKAFAVVNNPLRSPKTKVFLGAVTTALLLASCRTNEPQDTFSPAGSPARDIKNLAMPVFLIAIAVGIAVYLVVLFCVFKFRRKSEDHVPKQVHGNSVAEIAWTATPAVFLGIIGVLSVGAVLKQASEPKNQYNITVIGHQWWWEVHYPQVGEMRLTPSLVTKEDPQDVDLAKSENRPVKMLANQIQEAGPVIVTANEIHIPAGQMVRAIVTSADVIHSFWVPKLAGKQDAVPGHLQRWTIEGDKPGIIDGQCAEFCGASHADMRMKVVVDSPADFQAWLKNQASPRAEATGDPKTDLVAKGAAQFVTSGCTTCHYTDSSKPNSMGITGHIGPNLTHVAARHTFAGATQEFNTRNLTAWLRGPQKLKPRARMVIGKLSPDEIESLVAYVESLK